MAQKRKPKGQRPEATGHTTATGGPPRASAPLTPNPPKPHLWFLLTSGTALAAWLVFLLVMALRG